MNLYIGKRVAEATIQAEFYHLCRVNKIRCYLEYRYGRSRFDGVLYNEDKSIYAIIEFKSRYNTFKLNKDGRQFNKYMQYDIPLIYVVNMKSVIPAINYIKQGMPFERLKVFS